MLGKPLTIRYDTIRYNVVYLTCSKKLTCSQLSPPHGTNREIKEKNELNINRLWKQGNKSILGHYDVRCIIIIGGGGKSPVLLENGLHTTVPRIGQTDTAWRHRPHLCIASRHTRGKNAAKSSSTGALPRTPLEEGL